MAELYTIKLEDQVTGNAYRIAAAYTDVSVAAQYLARSVKSADKDMIALDKHQLKVARTQLMAAKAAQSAGNAIAKIGPKMGTTTAAVVKHTQAQAAATAQSFRFSYALNALTSKAIDLGFALARRLASGLADAASGLYTVADLATRAHMSFANFYGGQELGDKTLRESIDIAKRYGFTIEDTVAQMQRFGAAGFTAEQAKGTMRFGADMLAAGRSVQDVKGIFLAMTQIMGKGKLQAEELTQQLAERGINAGRVWQILGGILHKTVPQVMALQKAGKIGAGVALNAIVQAGVEGVHGGQIGKAGEKVADATIGGLARRMSTEVESQIFNAVDAATPKLVSGMQSIFAGLTGIDGGGLQSNLTKMLESVGEFLEKVGPKLPAIAENFERAFSSAAGFDGKNLNGFVDALPELAASLGTIAGTLVTIANAMAKIVSLVPQIGPGSSRPTDRKLGFAAQIGLQSDRGVSTGESIEAWANVLGTRANNWLRGKGEEQSEAVIDGMNFGMDKGAPSVAKSASGVAESAIDASSSTLQENSPSRVFKDQGAHVAEGLTMGMDQNADLAMHSAEMLAQGTIAAHAGAAGLDSRRAVAAGSAAGDAISSRSSTAKVRIGDIYIGGQGNTGGSGGVVDREYFETEFVSFLERHLEGVGA